MCWGRVEELCAGGHVEELCAGGHDEELCAGGRVEELCAGGHVEELCAEGGCVEDGHGTWCIISVHLMTGLEVCEDIVAGRKGWDDLFELLAFFTLYK